jgi:hypothetical protein
MAPRPIADGVPLVNSAPDSVNMWEFAGDFGFGRVAWGFARLLSRAPSASRSWNPTPGTAASGTLACHRNRASVPQLSATTSGLTFPMRCSKRGSHRQASED